MGIMVIVNAWDDMNELVSTSRAFDLTKCRGQSSVRCTPVFGGARFYNILVAQYSRLARFSRSVAAGNSGYTPSFWFRAPCEDGMRFIPLLGLLF